MFKNTIIVLVVLLVGTYAGFKIQNFTAKEVSEEDIIKEEVPIEEGLSTDTDNRTREAEVLDIEKELILDLSGQNLVKAPDNIFNRNELEELNLSNNQIEGALQAEVRHLQNLKVLNLSNNKFTGLPAEVGQLKNLEVLNLANNNLTGLPYELGNLANLKVLDLRGNDYAEQDLEIIKKSLPDSVSILTD